MKWFLVLPNTDIRPNPGSFFKPHVFSDEKKDAILADFKRREFCKEETIPVTEENIDLPGIVSMDRSWHEFQIDGLKLGIPSANVEIFMEDIATLKIREGDYYKLHGFMRCFCFSEAQKTSLLEQMKKVLPECAAIADLENQRFNEALYDKPHKNILVAKRPVRKIGDA